MGGAGQHPSSGQHDGGDGQQLLVLRACRHRLRAASGAGSTVRVEQRLVALTRAIPDTLSPSSNWFGQYWNCTAPNDGFKILLIALGVVRLEGFIFPELRVSRMPGPVDVVVGQFLSIEAVLSGGAYRPSDAFGGGLTPSIHRPRHRVPAAQPTQTSAGDPARSCAPGNLPPKHRHRLPRRLGAGRLRCQIRRAEFAS